MEDHKLLQLLRKNPCAGIEQLMNQYTALVYAVIKGKLSESYYVSSDVEDCVADVFSEFYTELAKYDPKVSSIKSTPVRPLQIALKCVGASPLTKVTSFPPSRIVGLLDSTFQ